MKQPHFLNILLALGAFEAKAFVAPASQKHKSSSLTIVDSPMPAPRHKRVIKPISPTQLCSTSETLSLQLEKPLGLILEEDEESGSGVIVTQVKEGGSAYNSPDASKLIGSKIRTVTGKDVSSLSFDDVMDVIIGADSPLNVEFSLKSTATTAAPVEEKEEEPAYAIGTDVLITVQQPEANKPDIVLNAKVGDNLRKTLLNNKEIELYRGLKKKLGNCGGGGQCGFCAVELIDGEGCWGERSDYEAQKIGKNGSDKCRLACMNNIAGPATVVTL
ncbi:hypothetical protein ACHAXN_002784 [Cyclotella atomus]